MKKILFVTFALICLCILCHGAEFYVNADTGNDANVGTVEKPFRTVGKALNMTGDLGGTIHVYGVIRDGIHVGKVKYKEPLIVDGHNNALVYGFDGKFQPFDPASQPVRNWKRLVLDTCHNVTVQNLEVWGGQQAAVELQDNDINVGLKNVTLRNVTVKYGSPRGIFMGGSVIDGVLIAGCRVFETCYGDTTHGIYLSGGQWRSECPPISNIVVKNCTVAYTGGRHGCQVNGRFKNVGIFDNIFYHCELGGLSLIGVQEAVITGNVIYGCNRSPIIIYDYFDSAYHDPDNPESWLATHHPSGNILIHHNTLLVGPEQWHMDRWHNNKPDNQAAIHLSNTVNQLGVPWSFGPVIIEKNILCSPWPCMLKVCHETSTANAITFRNNMVWTSDLRSGPTVEFPWGEGRELISAINEVKTTRHKNNWIKNPGIWAQYAFVNRCAYPDYDFSKHQTDAHMKSIPGQTKGIGADSGPWSAEKEPAKKER